MLSIGARVLHKSAVSKVFAETGGILVTSLQVSMFTVAQVETLMTAVCLERYQERALAEVTRTTYRYTVNTETAHKSGCNLYTFQGSLLSGFLGVISSTGAKCLLFLIV